MLYPFLRWGNRSRRFKSIHTTVAASCEALEGRRLLSAVPELVRDINTASRGSKPGRAVDLNGTAYFTVESADNGAELWKTDGTPAGTLPVKDAASGTIIAGAPPLANVDDTLFF